MRFTEYLLFSLPFFFLSLLHLIFCILFKKKPADILKLTLMPSLAIPVTMALVKNCIPISLFFLLIGVLTGAFAGDYFLIKPVSKKKFFYGLIAFFLSHVFYLIILIPVSRYKELPLFLIIVLILFYIVLVYAVFLVIGKPKGLRGLAAIIYSILLLSLQFFCLSPFLSLVFQENVQKFTINSRIILLGVLLFTISDILLAFSLFKKEFKYSRFSVMATYIAAQFFLVTGIISCF